MKKTQRRAVWGILAAGTIAVLLLVLTWAQRPRWRTFTFPANPKTGLAVAIDYPDDWKIGTMFQRPTNLSSHMQIELVPHPPQGVVRWWMEKVLRQEVVYDDTDAIFIEMQSGSDYKVLPAMEKEASSLMSPGNAIKLIHDHHALGPALIVSGTVSAGFFGNPNGNSPGKIYGMAIDLQAKDRADMSDFIIGAMTSERRFPRFVAAIRAMIPRIHLIRVADTLRHP